MKKTFCDELRKYVATIGCDLFSNGLMNSVTFSEGLVFRESGTVGDDDRDKLSSWLERQIIKCTITVGPLEDYETSSVVTEINGDVFAVDNLSDFHPAEAIRERYEMESWIEAQQNGGRPT